MWADACKHPGWMVIALVAASGAGCMPQGMPMTGDASSVERLTIEDSLYRDISYLRGGDAGAPRVIFVHGTPGSAANMSRYVSDPIEGFEVVSIDRPGFGKTGGPAEPSFEKQAAAIEPFLVTRGGQKPVLVGHSLGGPIVARAAADYPESIGAIVILSGSLDPALEKPRWFNHLGDLKLFRIGIGRDLRNSNDELMAAPGQTSVLDAVLERVRCPVFILHGRDDGLVPVANVDYMERAFVNAVSVEPIVLEDEGHFIPWTRERLVRETVRRAAAASAE